MHKRAEPLRACRNPGALCAAQRLLSHHGYGKEDPSQDRKQALRKEVCGQEELRKENAGKEECCQEDFCEGLVEEADASPGKQAGSKGSCKPKASQSSGEKKADSRAAAGSKLRKGQR